MNILDCLSPDMLQPETDVCVNNWCEKKNFNGQLVGINEPIGDIMSSFLNNGICIRESIVCQGNQPFMWREHYLSMCESLNAVGINSDKFLAANDLLRKIQVLCQKNHYPPYSLFRIYIWQQTDTLDVQYVIVQQRLQSNPYNYTEEKIFLTIYHDIPVYTSPLTSIDMPSPIDAVAQKYARDNSYDGACLTNQNGRIITTTLGNIYLMHEYDIIAVRYSDGSRRDPIDTAIDQIAKELGYNLKYTNGITPEMINKARECFVANSTHGLRAIDGCNQKRFFKKETPKLAGKLRDLFVF